MTEMREILFRAKRVDNDKWEQGSLLIYPDVNRAWMSLGVFKGGSFIEVRKKTVGQFTGLTDKNGKKIFEGDIILFEDECPSNYEYYDCTEMRCGAIEFDDGQFYLTNRIAVEMEDLIYDGVIEGEVVGNIHDNPELLGGDQNAR